MKVFRCDHCGSLTFFENTHCLACGHSLAYLPDAADMGALEPAGDDLWKLATRTDDKQRWRLCSNYRNENICNWAVPADDPDPLCLSCRFTRVIPDQNVAGNRQAWCRLESAKRRLFYTLLDLKLPLVSKTEDAVRGLAFEFLADSTEDGPPVLSGHAGGVITLNIAEADDAERERRRTSLGEPYRTIIGHFRHEIGHYYWDLLIAGSERLPAFRELFGDETRDYGEALKAHYANGPAEGWQDQFVSTYASAHPWEDWAETWAHYLHIVDALSTAADAGLSLRPKRRDQPKLTVPVAPEGELPPFDRMIDSWFPLTYVLNNLNRGLGLLDGYPFVLSKPAIEKLRFVHDTITTAEPLLPQAAPPAATPGKRPLATSV